MSRTIIYDICLFPFEIVDLVLEYAPAPVNKCLTTIVKHSNDHQIMVGQKRLCSIDQDCLVVYSGTQYKPTQITRCLPSSLSIAMLVNDNLLALTNDSLVIYDTSANIIDMKIQYYFGINDKPLVISSEIKPSVAGFVLGSTQNKGLKCAPNPLKTEEISCELDVSSYAKYIDNLHRDVASKSIIKTIFHLQEECIPMYCAIAYRDNHVAISNSDDIYIYKICGNDIQYTGLYSSFDIQQMIFLKNLDYLAVLNFEQICIYELKSKTEQLYRCELSSFYNSIIESPDGKRLLIFDKDCNSRSILIDPKTCNLVGELPFRANVCFRDNENIIAIKDDKIITWNESYQVFTTFDTEKNGKQIYQLPDGSIFVNKNNTMQVPILGNLNCKIIGKICGVLKNGIIVSETDDGTIKFWGN